MYRNRITLEYGLQCRKYTCHPIENSRRLQIPIDPLRSNIQLLNLEIRIIRPIRRKADIWQIIKNVNHNLPYNSTIKTQSSQIAFLSSVNMILMSESKFV